MLVMVSAVLPLFVSVTIWLELVVPTACAAKVSDEGVKVTEELAIPVPLRLAVLDPAEVLSLTVTVAVRVPVVVGVNVTLMVQLAPPARLLPQVLVCA
jgi:hypothetical protein